jgi:cytoskeleton protein RodZ
MPEIGPTLREARMRARIDITEVEQATKIRAKYLRAIENEEWQLLPGSTFAKSFIRGYADYLGIDSRSLVEEYKLRYERPSETELRPVSAGLSRDRRGGGRGGGGRGAGGGGRGVPRWAITLGLVAILIAALYLVGSRGGSDNGGNTTPTQPRTTPATSRDAPQRRQQQTRRQTTAPRTIAGVRLVPTGDVYVCLVDQDGRALIPGTIYRAGDVVPVQRARSLRLTLGNSNVQMRANGRVVDVPSSSSAIGFAVTPSAVRPLSQNDQPTCT